MDDEQDKGIDRPTRPDEMWPPVDEWPDEAHAAATFFAAALFHDP
jgi:hypothetical protein